MQINRRKIVNATLSTALVGLGDLAGAASEKSVKRMPSIFVAHGSPMNAIQDNDFTRALQRWGQELGRPKAILVVSAHWLTPNETRVAVQAQPQTIHDFGGFPQALFDMQYPAAGSPEFAKLALKALVAQAAKPSTDWGLDHGAWSVLHHMFPKADVPVFQVSIDYAKGGAHHLAVGRALAALRDRGVLVLGSGNVTHNLRAIDFDAAAGLAASRPWAQTFDAAVKAALLANDTAALTNYLALDPGAKMAVPSPDHYWPLLYAVGAASASEKARFVYEGFQAGTLSMRCVQWG
ncbi:MAG: 4,5-DOPA dioxygenase extradiol [Rhodoferax sp.]|nr:4,5-DOPA dioxygenase extradiol [Rhodoferax sp.]